MVTTAVTTKPLRSQNLAPQFHVLSFRGAEQLSPIRAALAQTQSEAEPPSRKLTPVSLCLSATYWDKNALQDFTDHPLSVVLLIYYCLVLCITLSAP